MKEFLLSDETVNSFGFSVLTSGIDLSRFEKNPVMFYNHNRQNGVIGKWTNIKKVENKLFGTPVFDEKDDLGNKISGKVNDGFIKAVSIGIENAEWGKIDSVPVVLTCQLSEVSVCDIPSNQNALVLYVDNQPVTSKDEIMKLYNPQKLTTMNEDLKKIIKALGLDETATVEDIVNAIGQMKQTEAPESAVEEAAKLRLFAESERSDMLQMAQSNLFAFQSFIGKRKAQTLKEREEKGMKLINEAFKDARINNDPKGVARNFWLENFKSDYETTENVLSNLPKRQLIHTLIIPGGNSEDRTNWTLNDYRKKAPKELQNNPALYDSLLQAEKEKNKH